MLSATYDELKRQLGQVLPHADVGGAQQPHEQSSYGGAPVAKISLSELQPTPEVQVHAQPPHPPVQPERGSQPPPTGPPAAPPRVPTRNAGAPAARPHPRMHRTYHVYTGGRGPRLTAWGCVCQGNYRAHSLRGGSENSGHAREGSSHLPSAPAIACSLARHRRRRLIDRWCQRTRTRAHFAAPRNLCCLLMLTSGAGRYVWMMSRRTILYWCANGVVVCC